MSKKFYILDSKFRINMLRDSAIVHKIKTIVLSINRYRWNTIYTCIPTTATYRCNYRYIIVKEVLTEEDRIYLALIGIELNDCYSDIVDDALYRAIICGQAELLA